MIFEAQLADPTIEREHRLIHDCIDQAVYAEEMGFDRIWAVEHHALRWYSHMSAPEVFLSAVATRTSRIRIGHAAVCMPFNYNYPTRVAERAAMLDIISNGRLDLGAARGATLQEMSLCNVDPERTRDEVGEALRVIGSAWQADTFEWHSDLLTISAPGSNPPHTILPRPVQSPHPPLYLACSNIASVELAAAYGVGVLALGFAGPASVREQREAYDAARAERSGDGFVSTVVNDHFSALCPTIVLDDGREAREVGARGQRFFGESISHWGFGADPPNESTEGEDNIAFMRSKKLDLEGRYERGEFDHRGTTSFPLVRAVSKSNVTSQFNIDHAYGTAEEAVEYVRELEAVGVDEVMCLIQMGTVPQEVCLETIRQWGERVIPAFAGSRGGISAVTGDERA